MKHQATKMAMPFNPHQDWNMRVDLNRQLQFPTEMTTISLWPDIVMRSTKARAVLLIELTVLLEEGTETAFEHKKAKY